MSSVSFTLTKHNVQFTVPKISNLKLSNIWERPKDCGLFQIMNHQPASHEQLIVPKKYARRLYYSGMVSIISVVVSLYLGMYDFTLIATGVFVNSINYWRHPIQGWRRQIDMLWACGGCLYQMHASFRVESYAYFLGYWVMVALALVSYRVARRYGRVEHDFDASSKWHMSLHLWGNISNMILYYGLFYS